MYEGVTLIGLDGTLGSYNYLAKDILNLSSSLIVLKDGFKALSFL